VTGVGEKNVLYKEKGSYKWAKVGRGIGHEQRVGSAVRARGEGERGGGSAQPGGKGCQQSTGFSTILDGENNQTREAR